MVMYTSLYINGSPSSKPQTTQVQSDGLPSHRHSAGAHLLQVNYASPISFDEAEMAIPILPASLQVVSISDGPSNNQVNPLIGEGESKHTNPPTIIDNEAGA
jgi:hypothetical protein